MLKKTLKIIGVTFCGLIILFLILVFIDSSGGPMYAGSENPITGEWCDFGFYPDKKRCCGDDEYECEVCDWKNYECSDFESQKKAQMTYELCENFDGIRDMHNLDRNNDSVACENLK